MMKLSQITLVSVLMVTLVQAQTYNFDQFGEEKGLAHTYIYCISQSKQGELLMSAGEALCKFDGLAFSAVYDKNMKENIVTTHFIDPRGVIWLGHQQHGLSYIDYKHPKPFNDTLISQVKISQIIGGDHKRVWLAGNNGIYSIDTNLALSALQLPQEDYFKSLAFDSGHKLLAGSMQGVYVIEILKDKKAGQIKMIDALKDKNVKQIVAADSSASGFWVLADDVVYGIASGKGSYHVTTTIAAESSESNGISCIYRDHYNNLWISSFGSGLRKLSFSENPVQGRYTEQHIGRRNGLKSLNIQSIFQDAEGNMWFGTFGDGLIKKPMELFSFFGANEGIKISDVKKVIKDRNDLWMATDEGLAVFNRDSKMYQVFNAGNGFVNDKVTTLYKDRDNTLWIGTQANGIYRMDLSARKMEHFSQLREVPLSDINCLLRSGNSLLAGTTDGIFVFDIFSQWHEHLSMNDGLLHNNVTHLFEDSKHRLWASSRGAPPYYIFQQKVTSFKKIKGLGAYNIVATCEDRNGSIWIATDGDGVFKYDNNEFTNYTTANGLISNYCSGIETDRNNSVWVTHRSGLSEMKSHLKKFTGFTILKGLLFSDNNTNAIYKNSDGGLWFGTTQGVVAYNVESGLSMPDIPEIFITEIQLNKENFIAGEHIVKPYGYYSVHIGFKAISLTDPNAIYYKYRFANVDTVWKTTNMQYVDFPKLDNGNYTFEVMACNASNGICSAAPALVSFTIQKPVWKHAWFYLLMLCLVLAALYVFVQYRTRALKKTQAVLQLKVEEKTFLLKREKEAVEQIKTDLEHKNKDITDSILYAKNIQDSLLPPDELMKDLFHNQSFVLFKPKDIVSGDFYWCSGKKSHNGQELHLAAVIDCTGHGVPGAFLSILANDFLKQSLSEERVAMPNEILNYLNSGISTHLNQHSSKSKIRDGMDIAMVGIDYSRRKLYYAGANNPIYIFRKTNNGVEERIIKATKQAIGSVNDAIMDYDLQTIDLSEGDMVYLFSDGYADQFGGARNKKITYKTFRTILSEAFLLPICQQKKFIEDRLEAWKNGGEQTDDVCVMGIRV